MKILLTGSSGFIGSRLVQRLVDDKHDLKLVVRKKTSYQQEVIVKDISTFSDWDDVLRGVEVVVHLAGRAHVLNDQADNPLEIFRKINTEATVLLAKSAASAGVKRFIFISSIGVNGNVTHHTPFSAYDTPCPNSPYAQSKYEAEIELKEISRTTGLQVVIIRPPLVHGPGAPGNFQKMVRWLERGVPLPLAGITSNARSMVGLDNLVDLISVCLDHPKAANETFLVSDDEDVSTTELLLKIGTSLKIKPNLFSMPPVVLRFVARGLGRNDLAQRLLDSLQVDIQHTCDTLGWRPPFSMEESFSAVAVSKGK